MAEAKPTLALDLAGLALPDPALRPSALEPASAATPTPDPAAVAPSAGRGATPVADRPTPAPRPTARTVRPALSEIVAESPTTSDENAAARAAMGRAAARKALRQRLDAIERRAETGQVEQARQEYLTLAQSFSRSPEAGEALFQAAVLLGADAPSALEELYRVVELYPRTEASERALVEIGSRQTARGNLKEGAEAFAAYYALAPEKPLPAEAEMDYVRCLVGLGRFPDAVTRLRALYERDVQAYDSLRGLELRSQTLIGSQRYEEATRILRRIVSRHGRSPAAPRALLNMGLCFEEMGRVEEARKAYALVVEFFPPGGAQTPPETALAQHALARLSGSLFAVPR